MPSNNSEQIVEHFVTLFDNNFLPMGMCLHFSMMRQCQPFHLWIVCMDDLVEQHLRILALQNVSLIPLREVEDDALLAVKPSRSPGEYCWTLTPFTARFVFARDSSVRRVTYLDADLFFFDSPKRLMEEFEQSGKHVLITEHGYPPKLEASARAMRAGRFCVQFITFRQTPEAKNVMDWWQARCLEWCYARVENGKYGDQKYLDSWPTLFEKEVHILQQKEKALAPWNVKYYAEKSHGRIEPVFYHFHGFRHVSPGRLLLYSGYKVGLKAGEFYQTYLDSFIERSLQLRDNGIAIPILPLRNDLFGFCLRVKRRYWDGEEYATAAKLTDSR